MLKMKNRLMIIAVICFAIALPGQAFAGVSGFYFNGGLQTGNYYGATGNIECDVLQDVGNDASAWVMVAGGAADEYIQAGWGRHWDQSSNWHFYQYSGDSFFHEETSVASANSTYAYKVERSGNTWTIYIDGSSEATANHTNDLGWTAQSAQFFGEIHDSTDDQSPGTVTDPITMSYLKVKSTGGTWSNASLTNVYDDLSHQKNNADPGDNTFEQWDNRY